MPILSWIGKEQVVNHHHQVPFRVLESQSKFEITGHQNLFSSRESTSYGKVVHGDNLEALKALLPQYEGQIKCIYIDPPYNTGNEGWVYNDNVNDPKIKRWLNQVVGKEGEDLSRHDKWLCMMYPRLKLLHKLLSNDGAIFISVDDNEQANLKLVLDEIFGPSCFVTNVIWQKRYTRSNNTDTFTNVTEYITVYSKRSNFKPNLLGRSEEANDRYSNPDNDPRGPWKAIPFLNQVSPEARPNLCYDVLNPNTKEVIKPVKKAWRSEKAVWDRLVEEDRVWWGQNGQSKSPNVKRFLSEVKQGITPINFWDYQFAGHTDNANAEIKAIFGSKLFDTPKPSTLIQRVLELCTDKDSIVLDSFAGSGTTAHAVLNLNKIDGGRRQFILIEVEDYAETITAERVRRVMQGYGGKEGTGGQFQYYTLGERLFDESGNLNPVVSTDKIRQYIWFTETKGTAVPAQNDEIYRLGIYEGTAYYFCYDPEATTTLDYELLGSIQTQAEQYIIYADSCTLSDEYLQQKHIIFKKIPRDITRL